LPTSEEPGVLVVASAGGHLVQARLLAPRIIENVSMWVSYDVPQVRTMLTQEQVIYAHHPTTKNLPNAVRNYRLARRVLMRHDIRRVVSTGAAVSVPFMLRARQLGMPCDYIESATRITSPSLSGRILERVPGVRLYSQHQPYNARWRAGPSVFDGYRTSPTRHAGGRSAGKCTGPLRVFVSLGTHGYPFHSLVWRMYDLATDELDVVWQLGATPDPGGLPGRVVEQLPPDELESAIRTADVVVGHAGVGLTLTALALGTVPVLVPRHWRRGEHTDDHQVELARDLALRGLAIVAEVEELTVEHLRQSTEVQAVYEPPPAFGLTRLD
jgi:UDP-N-acetylglucosamine--N-acetylmuramyl-(pentapeptide) pyrophosphoryl-undecaprenol N-acetylglucosamine transferase